MSVILFSGSAPSRSTCAAASRPRGRGLRTVFASVVSAWREARHRSRTRTYLLDLDDRALKDIGVSRAQAEFEARKWF